MLRTLARIRILVHIHHNAHVPLSHRDSSGGLLVPPGADNRTIPSSSDGRGGCVRCVADRLACPDHDTNTFCPRGPMNSAPRARPGQANLRRWGDVRRLVQNVASGYLDIRHGRGTQYAVLPNGRQKSSAVGEIQKHRCGVTDAIQACRTDGRVSDSDMPPMMSLAMVD